MNNLVENAELNNTGENYYEIYLCQGVKVYEIIMENMQFHEKYENHNVCTNKIELFLLVIII